VLVALSSLDTIVLFCYNLQVKRGVWVSNNQPSALDSFIMFYEDLRFIKPSDRIKRPTSGIATK
jgi:hypothetical protein